MFCWAQRGSDYEYGEEFRDKNSTNSDQGNFEINDFFGSNEMVDVVGFVAIHVGDLLISGNGALIRYLTQKMKGKFEVDSYEENEATYLGAEITKEGNEDSEGAILDSNKYGGG